MTLDLVQRYKAPELAVAVDPGARTVVPGTGIGFSVDPITGAITIINTGSMSGGGEILVADGTSAPPIMLTNEAEDDFLYGD